MYELEKVRIVVKDKLIDKKIDVMITFSLNFRFKKSQLSFMVNLFYLRKFGLQHFKIVNKNNIFLLKAILISNRSLRV